MKASCCYFLNKQSLNYCFAKILFFSHVDIRYSAHVYCAYKLMMLTSNMGTNIIFMNASWTCMYTNGLLLVVTTQMTEKENMTGILVSWCSPPKETQWEDSNSTLKQRIVSISIV